MELLPGTEAKIAEYVLRIQKGENKELVLKDIGSFLRDAVESRLGTTEVSKTEELKPEQTEEEKIGPLETAAKRRAEETEKKERKEKELQQIAEIREKMGAPDTAEKINDPKIEELEARLEKYQVSFPNIDSIIVNEGGRLSVVINGKEIAFDKFDILISEPFNGQRVANVGFIEKKNKTEDKGIGLPMYVELGKRLAEKGITLSSSGSQYAQGQSIWFNLVRLGYAKRSGLGFEFITNSESKEKKEEKLGMGTKVLYNGEDYKVADVIEHTYEGGRKVYLYNLENRVGTILQEGGVKKYIDRSSFDVV